jgi:hypothetical protein
MLDHDLNRPETWWTLELANYCINLTVRPVTGRACARPAPVRPAGYAMR